MAKRHRKHHRKYGRHHRRHHRGFGALIPNLKQSTQLGSVLFGAGLGLAVGAGAKAVISSNTMLQQAIPTFAQNGIWLLGSILGGGAAYLIGRKKNHAAAVGHFAGAVAIGTAITLQEALVNAAPQTFSGVVELNLSNGAKVKAMKGLLVASASPPFPPQAGRFNGFGLMARSAMPYRGTISPSSPAGRGPQDLSMLTESDPMDDNAP